MLLLYVYGVFACVCICTPRVRLFWRSEKGVRPSVWRYMCVCHWESNQGPRLLLLSRLSTLARLFGTIGTLKLMEEHRCLKYLLVVITGLCHHALLCVSGQNQLLEGTLTSPLGLGGTHHIIMFPGQDAPMGTEAQQLWCRAEGDGHRTRAV